MKYQFYSDPSHGWLKVSIQELEQLGIQNKISSYSYMNKGFAYLEEDCDLSLFFKTKGFTDFDKNVKSNRQSNKQSKIRSYDSYDFVKYQTQESVKERFDLDPLFRKWVLKVIRQESKSNWLDNFESFESLGKNGKKWILYLAEKIHEKINLQIEIEKIYCRENNYEDGIKALEIQKEFVQK